jgi:hypothetical protein
MKLAWAAFFRRIAARGCGYERFSGKTISIVRSFVEC